jgi:hypothetical protein
VITGRSSRLVSVACCCLFKKRKQGKYEMGCVNYRCLSVYWHENVMYIFFCDKYQDILNYDGFQWNFKFEIFLVPKNTNVITFLLMQTKEKILIMVRFFFKFSHKLEFSLVGSQFLLFLSWTTNFILSFSFMFYLR